MDFEISAGSMKEHTPLPMWKGPWRTTEKEDYSYEGSVKGHRRQLWTVLQKTRTRIDRCITALC